MRLGTDAADLPGAESVQFLRHGTGDRVIDRRTFSDFCGVDSNNQVPDRDTLGCFRNLLVKNNMQKKFFAQVVDLLTQRRLILKRGTIVASTFIEAPSSTKNKKRT